MRTALVHSTQPAQQQPSRKHTAPYTTLTPAHKVDASSAPVDQALGAALHSAAKPCGGAPHHLHV